MSHVVDSELGFQRERGRRTARCSLARMGCTEVDDDDDGAGHDITGEAHDRSYDEARVATDDVESHVEVDNDKDGVDDESELSLSWLDTELGGKGLEKESVDDKPRRSFSLSTF